MSENNVSLMYVLYVLYYYSSTYDTIQSNTRVNSGKVLINEYDH